MGSALPTHTSAIVPGTSHSSSFMSFIASMMQSVSPFFTRLPTSTYEGASGAGARKKVPTMGDLTSTRLLRAAAGRASSVAAGAGPIAAGGGADGARAGAADEAY